MWLQTNLQGLGWRREVCCGSGLGSQIRGGTEVCCGSGLGSQIRGGTEVCCGYGLDSQIRVEEVQRSVVGMGLVLRLE